TTTPEAPPDKAQPNTPAEAPREPRPAITPPVQVTKADATESVQFVTDPPNAQLTIDGSSGSSCKTPCMLPLSAGRHSLNVQMDGYRSHLGVFNVPQDKELFIQLAKANGTLSITSNPTGATIEINGETQTKHTPAIFNFPPGNYRVKVSRNGAFLEFDVQLRDGEFLNKKVDF